MIKVVRAEQRYRTSGPGITTWSCFATGSHYEADNVAFGPLVAVDDHLLDPGAGFEWHPHRGVDLVTCVLSGTLRHTDDTGADRSLGAGEFHLQRAGGGVRHAEVNASASRSLRMLQMSLLSPDDVTGSTVPSIPINLPVGALSVLDRDADLPARRRHLHVLAGQFSLYGGTELLPGDTLRADESVRIVGSGRALLWTFPDPE